VLTSLLPPDLLFFRFESGMSQESVSGFLFLLVAASCFFLLPHPVLRIYCHNIKATGLPLLTKQQGIIIFLPRQFLSLRSQFGQVTGQSMVGWGCWSGRVRCTSRTRARTARTLTAHHFILSEEHKHLPIMKNQAVLNLVAKTVNFIPTPSALSLIRNIPLSLNILCIRVYNQFSGFIHRNRI
jgi:hypothetical protein